MAVISLFLWLILLLICVYLLIKTWIFYVHLRPIPSPPGSPIIGNLLFFLADRRRLFYRIREYSANHYPIYRLSAFFITVVSLLDPRDIELVLSNTKHLSKTYAYDFLKKWLGTGLLTSTDEKWHRRRKILTPAFHFNILQQFIDVFNEESNKLVENLELETTKTINIIPFITAFTLQSIEETAMGTTNIDDNAHREYKDAIYKMGNLLLKRIGKPWLHIKAIYQFSGMCKDENKLIKILHGFTNKIISDKETSMNLNNTVSNKKRLAMLDLLLQAKANGDYIDHEGVREEVDTFMFEGHDTTAMAISYIFLTLANLPKVQETILEEILEVLGPTRQPAYNDLQELKYTERCIKEVLRLFPSVPLIARFAGETFKTVTGYTIPKGTILHFHIYDLHRNPNIYPDPLKFDPDRFLPENINERHPFAYIPFSAGPRNCIGQRFALLELKAVLCGVLRKYRFEKVDDMNDVKFRPDLVLRPQTEVRVKIFARD